MDSLKNAVGMGDDKQPNPGQEGQVTDEGKGGGFLGGIGDKLNSAAGGGRESEKNEDYLDKGMFVLSRRLAFPPPSSCQFLIPLRRSRLCSTGHGRW